MKQYLLVNMSNITIIDTSRYELKKEKQLANTQLEDFIWFYKNNTPYYCIKRSQIIKESDDLLDLICVGDLVEIDDRVNQPYVRLCIYPDEDGRDVEETHYRGYCEPPVTLRYLKAYNMLSKIYKRNKIGGYDLSWERVTTN